MIQTRIVTDRHAYVTIETMSRSLLRLQPASSPHLPPLQILLNIAMSLWVDQVKTHHMAARNETDGVLQFRPKTLDDLHYHQGLSARLKSLVSLSLF